MRAGTRERERKGERGRECRGLSQRERGRGREREREGVRRFMHAPATAAACRDHLSLATYEKEYPGKKIQKL